MSAITRLHAMNRYYNSPKYVAVEVTGDRQELLTQLGLDPTDEGLVLVERIIDHKLGVMDTKNNIFYTHTNNNIFYTYTNKVYVSATYNDVVMAFEDKEVKRICVANFGGLNGITNSTYGKTGVAGIDGEVTYEQVLAVTNIGSLFLNKKSINRFNELVYFKNLNTIANNAFSSCSLIEITLPNTVITGSVFAQCSSLRAVNTPFGLRFLTAQSMFFNCSYLSSLDVSGWDMGACTDTSDMFFNCSDLSSLDVSGWDMGACTNTSNMFYNTTYLSTLLGGSQDKPSALRGAKVALSVSQSPLDKASLLAIINGLANLKGKTQQTLTLGSTNKAKLTAAEITIATNKNWKIV